MPAYLNVMLKKTKISLFLTFLILLSSCFFDPDPPLFKTDLPNGYSFHSNGGIFGNIHSPNDRRLPKYFGIISDDREQWCNGFNWYKDFVVCELEIVKNQKYDEYTYGYLILNTSNENIYIVGNRSEAGEKWKQLTNSTFPELKKKHKNTKEK